MYLETHRFTQKLYNKRGLESASYLFVPQAKYQLPINHPFVHNHLHLHPHPPSPITNQLNHFHQPTHQFVSFRFCFVPQPFFSSPSSVCLVPLHNPIHLPSVPPSPPLISLFDPPPFQKCCHWSESLVRVQNPKKGKRPLAISSRCLRLRVHGVCLHCFCDTLMYEVVSPVSVTCT